MTRLQHVFSGYAITPILAALIAASIFGYGLYIYQGVRWFMMTWAIAIAFGAMFLLFTRNLWPMHSRAELGQYHNLYGLIFRFGMN